MTARVARVAFGVLLFAAAALRLAHIRWDDGTHLHPDERFISMVDEKLQVPSRLSEYFDSERSSFNPYNRGFGTFVYGTLPLLVTRAAASLVGRTGYDGAYVVGRALSAVFDLATVWLVYLIARRFAGRGAALVAAGLYAFSPLAIQLSHFWASDTFLTAFTAAALLGCVRIELGRSGPGGDLATGLAIGLAAACKITALALFAPVGLAILVRLMSPGLPRTARGLLALARDAALRLLPILVAAAVAARVALPYAFAGSGLFSFRLDPRWIADLKQLAALQSTVAGFPPALQWAGRTLLYPTRNFVLWGAAPFFGLAALASLAWGAAAVARRRAWTLAPLLVHALFLLCYHGLHIVKAMRYWFPAYPALAVLAALFLSGLARKAGDRKTISARLLRWSPAIALAGTALAGLAFSRIYARPLTRVAASDWIYAHVPPPARFANETWDDGLPLPRPGHENGNYAGPALAMFDSDSPAKVDKILDALREADWIAVTSGRVYSNVTRIPDVFPMTIAYYRALFDGRLGFERMADFASYPSLGPIRLDDDAAEEQFTVYDHPRVLLFRKTASFSPGRARRLLLAAIPTTPPAMNDWERWPRSRRRVAPPVRPSANPALEQRLAPAEQSETGVSSLWACVLFYLASLAVGLLAFPLAFVLFPRLADRGAGVARVLGLVLATYLLMVALHTRALANGRPAAFACLAALAAIGVAALLGRKGEIAAFWRERRRLVVHGEIAFAAGFLFFVGMRALNPEIYWGEKPMDFSILNILVRAPSLPPSDPWFAGAPLGYYYFGQEMIALLTLVSGLSTRYTFNLAFGLIGGLTLQGAFTLLRNWAGNLRAAVAGASFTGLLGDLAGLREWLINQPASAQAQHLAASQTRHLDWHYFWATSRVIKDTVNEYPFWSLIFGDLHAHVLAFPLFLLVAAIALQVVRSHADPGSLWRERIGSAVLLGFAAAAQALTSAWDVPLLAGLLVLILLVSAFPRQGLERAAVGRALLSFSVAAACALAFVLPLWVRGGGAPGHGRNTPQEAAHGIDVLTVFGLFFFLAIAWWTASARSRLTESGWPRAAATALFAAAALGLAVLAVVAPTAFCVAGVLLFLAAALASRGHAEDRLALGFAAIAFLLVFFTQRFYIYDRMNTIFKLYLEAWFLFSIGTAALVFRPADRPGSFARWGRPLRYAFYGLIALALFTAVTAAQGAIDRTTSPSARERASEGPLRRFVPARGPSLDGLRYLEDRRPGEYRAVLWLRRAIPGTPVVLEAQGPSYQDFGRISMLTGLPTVLGWEYHVQQRGNPPSQIAERKDAVHEIYSSPDAATAEGLLLRYHVGYVYVGWLERQTYPAAGLRKFGANEDLFALVYENAEARIYRVVGGDTQDMPTPTRETIEAPEGAGKPPQNEPEEPPQISETPQKGLSPFAGMREPRDAAVDEKGRVWIADFGNSRLRLFDAAGGFLGGWGGRGSGTWGLLEPCGVAASGADLYVADTWNGRIQRYALSGEWKSTATGLYGPRGVAVGPDGSVWVTDTGNHRVLRYSPDLRESAAFGKRGSGREELSSPVGIAAGSSGTVYVADTGNRRIQVLDGAGRFARAIPFPGWTEPGEEPHLEVDADENLFATDPGAKAIVELDRSGSVRRRWVADDAGHLFSRPSGVALDRKKGILYVVNSGNNSVGIVLLRR